MELLRRIHDFMIVGFPLPLFPTPFALISLVLFLWSLWVAYQQVVTPGFKVWLRLTWLGLLVPAFTGTLLALGGYKVPSAVDIGGGLTKYGKPFDPTQVGMHLLYSACALLTLIVLEVALRTDAEILPKRQIMRVLPIATLFLYGCAYMAGFVATFPGSTPGR